MTDADLEAVVHRHLSPVVGRRIPGVTAVVRRDDEVSVFALGDRADRPAPRSECWEMGSITKGITGLLLAEMVVAGAVALDDPIGRYLPREVADRLPPEDRQPTLEDLATHGAGLPRVPLRWMRRLRGHDPYATLTEQDVFDVLGPRTRRPRRERCRYSNLGMGLLGHLLARVDGRSYEEAVTDRILGPLGMRSSAMGPCAGAEMVTGHRKGRPTPAWTFGALAGAGALRSTVDDVVRFVEFALAPTDDHLAAAWALASTPRRPAVSGHRIGLGWMMRGRSDEGGPVWHNGATYGTSTLLVVDPSERVALVLLGNGGPRLVPPLDAPGWTLFDELAASRPGPAPSA
ncbi:MAG: serine hydrolase domain-containing protein [Acidimicrobiales bacterium]